MREARDRVPGRGGRTGGLRLEVVGGEGGVYEAEPGGPPITIGRTREENVFVVRDKSVSRRHAVIERTPEGYRVRDLESLNGVRLRGHRVPKEGALLADGDELQLGVALVRVTIASPDTRAEGPPTVVDTPPPPSREAAARRPAAPPPPPPKPPPARPGRDRPPPVDHFGHFEILRPLASGEPRRLDLAVDTRRGDEVTLLRVPASELGFFGRRRFRRAYEQARGLAHENLLVPLEVGQHEEDLYVLYPPIDGVTAAAILRDGGRDLRIELAVYVGREVCRALDYLAHAAGEGFRAAVSGRGVIVGRDGRVLLVHAADAVGAIEGEQYRAPEEDARREGDARAAVFSAGILLYELLAREPVEPRQKLALPSIDTVRLQVTPGLAEITTRALEVRAEDRFATAADLARALGEELGLLAPGFGAPQVASWIAERFR